MREIKFRVKTKGGKDFIPMTLNGTREFSPDIDWGTLCESTGLKDKNGVEIFEGDIVAWPLEGVSKVGGIFGIHYKTLSEVYWNVDRWSMKGTWGESRDGANYYTPMKFEEKAQEVDVIGNIYSNPDLLTQPKE